MRFSNTKKSDEGGFEPALHTKRRKPKLKQQPPDPGNWKTLQLCSQVRETLDMTLAELCVSSIDTLEYRLDESKLVDDDGEYLLERITIVSVQPAPDASRLCVTVTIDDDGP
ncbi:MAG: hypothetical protein FWD57_16270, partial [Polyangiaceae bacterium]|nr:hypothetical protein [Polyangiaceae bacterium]